MTRRFLHRLPLTAVAAFLLYSGAAAAQEAPPRTERPAAQPSGTNESLFGDNRVSGDKDKKFLINGRLSLDLQHLGNFDLDDGDDRDITRVSPEARVEFTYQPDDDFHAFLSLEFGLTSQRLDGDWDTDGRAEVREAYILAEDILFKDFEFQLGRQDVEDGREWLYDEQLDGFRFGYDHRDLEVYAGYFREELLRKDLLGSNDGRPKVDNFVVHAEYEMNDDWDVAAYILKQEDRRAGNVSPLFLGIQSEGQITPSFGHWLDLAVQRGEVGRRDQKAWAIDAGLIYFLEAPLRPAVFAGYARGSGGGNADTNREFRPTGLQDNEDRITGLGNVSYYGELLDPDLSNLRILTLGAGLRPTAASSIEVIWHGYRQVVLDDNDVRGAPVGVELNGDSRDIGREIDVVGAVRLGQGIGLEGKLGWFNPGRGYDRDNRDNAFFAKARVVFRF